MEKDIPSGCGWLMRSGNSGWGSGVLGGFGEGRESLGGFGGSVATDGVSVVDLVLAGGVSLESTVQDQGVG